MRTKYIYKELLCFSICFFLLGLNLVSAQSNDSVTVFNFESLGDTAELDKYIPLTTKELTLLKKLEIDFIKEGALIYWKNSPDKHFICNGDDCILSKCLSCKKFVILRVIRNSNLFVKDHIILLIFIWIE